MIFQVTQNLIAHDRTTKSCRLRCSRPKKSSRGSSEGSADFSGSKACCENTAVLTQKSSRQCHRMGRSSRTGVPLSVGSSVMVKKCTSVMLGLVSVLPCAFAMKERSTSTDGTDAQPVTTSAKVDLAIPLKDQFDTWRCGDGRVYCIAISGLDTVTFGTSYAQQSLAYLTEFEDSQIFDFRKEGADEAYIFMDLDYENPAKKNDDDKKVEADRQQGDKERNAVNEWAKERSNVTILHNHPDNIYKTVADIREKVRPNDIVYVSFNVHGSSAGCLRLCPNSNSHYKNRWTTKCELRELLFDKMPCPIFGIMSTCFASKGLMFNGMDEFEEKDGKSFSKHEKYSSQISPSIYPRILVATSNNLMSSVWVDGRIRHFMAGGERSIQSVVDEVNTARQALRPEANGFLRSGKTLLRTSGNPDTQGPNHDLKKSTSKLLHAINARRREI